MPSITYDSIYKRALTRIKDTELARLTENDMMTFLVEWLQSAISNPYLRKKFETFTPNDEIEQISFTLVNSVDETYDKNFVINTLAKGLIVNYFPSKLEKAEYLNMIVYGGEEKIKDNYKNAQNRLNVLTREYYRELSQHGYYFGKSGEES